MQDGSTPSTGGRPDGCGRNRAGCSGASEPGLHGRVRNRGFPPVFRAGADRSDVYESAPFISAIGFSCEQTGRTRKECLP